MPRFAKLIAAGLVSALLLAGGSSAQAASLSATLAAQMRSAGPYSGAYVKNVTDNRVVFSWNATRARILASNTKLFTTSAALARYGTEGTLGTEVLGRGTEDDEGADREEAPRHRQPGAALATP